MLYGDFAKLRAHAIPTGMMTISRTKEKTRGTPKKRNLTVDAVISSQPFAVKDFD